MKLLNESSVKTLTKMLNERFGQPVEKVQAHVGITDDRSGGDPDLGDTDKEKVEGNWSDYKQPR